MDIIKSYTHRGESVAFDGFGNRSRSFDGVSDYVSIPDNTDIPTGAQTIAFWMKLNTLTELVRPLTKFGSSDGQRSFLFVILTDGTIKNVINDTGYGEDNNPISSAASTISTGIWYHVAMRFIPSTEQTLYINGSSVASDTTNIPSQIFNSTAPIMVGSDPTFASYFDGNLADIRIYDTDLTATEISDLYAGTNITTNLVGHWLTDADNVLDAAGTNHGTNYGSKYSYDNPSPPVEFGSASRSFNGTSDCIDMGDVDGSIWQGVGAKFSIALWVKGIPTNDGIIFGKYGVLPTQSVEWALIGRNDGDVDFTAYGSLAGSSYVRERTDVAALSNDSWVHIWASFDQAQPDSDKIKIAINGSFVSTTQTLLGSNIAIQNGAEDLCIGSRDEGQGFRYNGKIADVRIYSTLLAESDFSDLASGVDVGTPWGHWLTDNDDVEDKAGTNDGTNFGSTYSYDNPPMDLIPSRQASRSFDGSNDYVDLGDSDDFSFTDGAGNDQPFSLAGWVKMDSNNKFRVLHKSAVVSGSAINELFYGTIGSGVMCLLLSNGNGFWYGIQTTSAIIENEWVHISATYDGTGGADLRDGMNIYVNGVATSHEAFVDVGSPTYTGISNTIYPLWIGKYQNNDTYADGRISDVRIYDAELTASQILDIYNGTTDRTNLIGQWLTNSDDVLDHAGTNDGTNNGSTYSTDSPS